MKRYALYAIRYTLCCILVFSLLGCDAFVRKFTRKPKKDNLEKEEMVLVPEEYQGPQMSKEELYRQHFLFWKSWHDEFIFVLVPNSNHKKQVDCVNEAIKNLNNLRTLLNDAGQKKLDVYIGRLSELKNSVAKDLYGASITKSRLSAERIKRDILRDFSYNKIKGFLA